MTEPIRSEISTVIFFDGLSVDGYRMPNGEFRVGITTASTVAGFSENYLRDVLRDKTATRFKTLQEKGFTGITTKQLRETKRGAREERSISLKDFIKLLRYADKQDKKSAGAILDALSELSLLDFFRDAFGEEPLTIEEKRRIFYEKYASRISPEGWRAMDREDILKLALPGDEEHLRDGNWNQ